MKRLLVINGHPDPRPERFCGAVSEAYASGGRTGGWQTRRIDVGALPLSTVAALEEGAEAEGEVAAMLNDIEWANRLAIVYPLWFDQPPAALRALFAAAATVRKAHLVVTMDMPAFAYRSMLRPGSSSSSLALTIPNVIPDEPVLIGCVSTITHAQRRQWLETVRGLAARGFAGSAAAPSRGFAAMIDRTVAQWRAG